MGDWACNRLGSWVVAAEPTVGLKARVFGSLSAVVLLPFALPIPVLQDEAIEADVVAVVAVVSG